MDIIKCLDTYALMEIMNENSKFAHYLNSNFVIADITLAEFYGVILREHGEEKADFWLKKLENYAEQVSLSILIEVVKFRHENKEKNLSWVDAIGYIFAKQNNHLFVTGDKEFESLEGVEFVKK
ncbi:MAG: PIN domain-containing protein [Nanoarchaeota archaeon]